MRQLRFIKNRYIILPAVILLCFGFLHIARAISAEPGTDSDPLVSQSYVDSKMSEFTSLASSLKQQVQSLETQGGLIFSVVEIKPQQQLVAGAGTEMILRSGTATAVQGVNGDGLADVTADAGVELRNGDIIPPNHLLIASRDDGRGLKTGDERAFILVKGSYTIK